MQYLPVIYSIFVLVFLKLVCYINTSAYKVKEDFFDAKKNTNHRN